MKAKHKKQQKPSTGTFYATRTKNKTHYATFHQFTLNDSIENMTQHIASHTYLQKWPAIFPQFMQQTLTHSAKKAFKPYKKDASGNVINNNKHIIRESHGVQHVSRATVLAEVMLGLYKRFGNLNVDAVNGKKKPHDAEYADILGKLPGNDRAAKEIIFLKLLQIATFYHDAGRYGEGIDRKQWEAAGARDCYLFIFHLLENSFPESEIGSGLDYNEIAKIFSKAIIQKDDKAFETPKNIIARLIGDADCLDIMRCSTAKDMRRNFFSRYIKQPRTRRYQIQFLNFWQDCTGLYDANNQSIIDNKMRAAAQCELVKVVLAERDYLKACGDLSSAVPIEVAIGKRLFTISSGTSKAYNEEAKLHYEKEGFDAAWQTANRHVPMFSKYLTGSGKNKRASDAQGPAATGNDLMFKLALIELEHWIAQVNPTSRAVLKSATDELKNALADNNKDKIEKTEAVRTFINATAIYRNEYFFPKLKNALHFAAIAAISIIVGVAIGVAATLIGTLCAGPVGSFAGLVVGAKFGAMAGASVGVALGGVNIWANMFNAKHREHVHSLNHVADIGRRIANGRGF